MDKLKFSMPNKFINSLVPFHRLIVFIITLLKTILNILTFRDFLNKDWQFCWKFNGDDVSEDYNNEQNVYESNLYWSQR